MDKFQSGKYKFSSVKPLFLIGNYVIEERGKEINILVDELIKAKKLCNQYNNLCIEDIEKGNEIIKKLFSKTGNEF